MFDYMYEKDVRAMQSIIIPKRLFSCRRYAKLSALAKVLYALLLDSCEDTDINNRPFAVYSIQEICEDFCCTANEAMELLTELTSYDLICCERGRIYVNDFEESEG